jgi:hypothetical protein
MALTPTEKSALQAEAAKLRKILANGAVSVESDGTRVTYDLGACRQRLRDITRTLNPDLRRRVSRLNLGGF